MKAAATVIVKIVPLELSFKKMQLYKIWISHSSCEQYILFYTLNKYLKSRKHHNVSGLIHL